MKPNPFFASFSFSPFTHSRHWSMIATMNGRETASSIVLNSHHITHVIYGLNKNDDLFAIMTFKERKDLNQVKNLYGKDVIAEPLPKSTRLRDVSDSGIIRNNKTFMRNNFDNVVELN